MGRNAQSNTCTKILFEEVLTLTHAPREFFFEEVYVLNLYKVNILTIDLKGKESKDGTTTRSCFF